MTALEVCGRAKKILEANLNTKTMEETSGVEGIGEKGRRVEK